MTKLITESTAKVYTVPGVSRRFLSRNAAIAAYCRRRVKSKYLCECEADTNYTCGLHTAEGYLRMDKIRARYSRYIRFLTSNKAVDK
jgi:hypothetical protein